MGEKVLIVLQNMTLGQKFFFQAVVLPELEYVVSKYADELLEIGEVK